MSFSSMFVFVIVVRCGTTSFRAKVRPIAAVTVSAHKVDFRKMDRMAAHTSNEGTPPDGRHERPQTIELCYTTTIIYTP